MNRWTVLLAAVTLMIFAVMGCSGGDGSPVTPTADMGLTEAVTHTGQVQTHLWGYYDVMIDIENQTVEAVPSRSTMFAANVVQFLNNNPAGLSFNILSTPIGPDYVDVTLDVAISHPLPGMPQYDGYDVRGVFIGDGSYTLGYTSGIRAGVLGTDQFHFNTDGCTRWFNPGEFPIPGLMGYTPGNFASPAFTGSGTCNSYKYYANGLGATASYWTFLNATAGQGKFASGVTNTRRYVLRFPNTKGVTYGYSVVASWISETVHPGNAVEAVGVNATVTPGVYYVDAGDNGGDLIVDFDVFCWGAQPDKIFIDSPVLPGDYEMTGSEMVPTGGSGHVSTYHVEIPANDVTSQDPSFFFVIPVHSGEDYTGEFTPPGGAPSAPLAAFFRFDLEVLEEAPCPTPDVLGCDFDPPNGLSQVSPGAYTGVEITGTGFEGPTCIVEFIGPSTTYTATTVVTNGLDTITCDIDLTGADLGWYDVSVENGCGKTGTGDDIVEVIEPPLFSEDFTSDPADWTYAYYQYWSGCSNTTVGYSTFAPFGPSGANGLRHSYLGGTSWPGGDLQTVVTPPFPVPSGASEVTLRVYMTLQFGGSYVYFLNSNFKIVENSTPGLYPFVSGDPASLPSGGAYMYPTSSHGGGFPSYGSDCGYGPLANQPGWNSTTSYGTGWPNGTMTTYADVVVPPSFYGKTVKVAFQLHPDWCGYPGSGGFAMDDWELMTW